MKQFRGIVIRLNHKVVVMNKKGEPVEEMHNDFFNVRINNSIPSNFFIPTILTIVKRSNN